MLVVPADLSKAETPVASPTLASALVGAPGPFLIEVLVERPEDLSRAPPVWEKETDENVRPRVGSSFSLRVEVLAAVRVVLPGVGAADRRLTPDWERVDAKGDEGSPLLGVVVEAEDDSEKPRDEEEK